jgi:hypothetical protein
MAVAFFKKKLMDISWEEIIKTVYRALFSEHELHVCDSPNVERLF